MVGAREGPLQVRCSVFGQDEVAGDAGSWVRRRSTSRFRFDADDDRSVLRPGLGYFVMQAVVAQPIIFVGVRRRHAACGADEEPQPLE